MKPLSSLELSSQVRLTFVGPRTVAARLLGASGGTMTGAVLVSLNQLKLPTEPLGAVSMTRRSTCVPAVIVMPLLLRMVQFCHPPVLGSVIGPVTSTSSTSQWTFPPAPLHATRMSSVKVPPSGRLTEYLSHSPGLT